MDDLTDEELAQAQRLIDAADPGVKELSEIYEDEWDFVDIPTSFGGRFKRSVEKGLLRGIAIGKPKTNNHQTYQIFGHPKA